MSDGKKLKEKREVRGMEGRQELFTECRLGGRAEIKDIKVNVGRKVSEMGGLGRGSIKCNGKGDTTERQRERDEGRRRQQTEFIFINGQRAERELLKRRKMNERMSVKEGRGDEGRCDICPLLAF